MKIPFWKMHGAGNDFILIDDRELVFPADDRNFIERIARRRTGIGCEGLILIQPDESDDFRMRFFNPDGGEAEMCGNGARCVARLAADIGAAPSRMSFATVAGRLRAETPAPGRVKLWMTEPTDWRMNQRIRVADDAVTCHFVNSGVPHAVVPVDDLAAVDVDRLGREIRFHDAFAPSGANVNFTQVTGTDTVSIRTYERGVEAETLACGTGIVAAGLVAGRLGYVKPPVTVCSAGGDRLAVDYVLGGDGADRVTLDGPAEYVFTGIMTYGEG